jgi:D-ribose pyranase
MPDATVKLRILNPELAAALATLRHGETIFVADAGSGTSLKSFHPLDPDVQIIDVAVATGIPTFEQVVSAIVAAGDIEQAIVTEDMQGASPVQRRWLAELLGEENVHEMPYIPDYYDLRDRAKVFIQTGDCGVHCQAVLVGGYPSPKIPISYYAEGTLEGVGRES